MYVTLLAVTVMTQHCTSNLFQQLASQSEPFTPYFAGICDADADML